MRLMLVWFTHATLTTLVWSRSHLCCNLEPPTVEVCCDDLNNLGAIWFPARAMRRPMTFNRPLAPCVADWMPKPPSSANLQASVQLHAVAGLPATPPATRASLVACQCRALMHFSGRARRHCLKEMVTPRSCALPHLLAMRTEGHGLTRWFS